MYFCYFALGKVVEIWDNKVPRHQFSGILQLGMQWFCWSIIRTESLVEQRETKIHYCCQSERHSRVLRSSSESTIKTLRCACCLWYLLLQRIHRLKYSTDSPGCSELLETVTVGTLPQVLTGITYKSSQLKSWQITYLRVSFVVCRGHSVLCRSEFDPDNVDIRNTMRETFTAHTHTYFAVLLSVEASCVHVCIVLSLPPIVNWNGYT